MSDPITRLNAALEGRYRIESELGEGGMATVYLAVDALWTPVMFHGLLRDYDRTVPVADAIKQECDARTH